MKAPGNQSQEVKRGLELYDADGVDDNVFARLVARTGCNAFNGVDNGLRGLVCDVAEDGVLALEPAGVHGGDEEL